MFMDFENQVKNVKTNDDELLIEPTSATSNKFDQYKEKMKQKRDSTIS